MVNKSKKSSLQKEAEEFAQRLRYDFDEKGLADLILEGLSPPEKTRRRKFNTAEKITAYVLAGGRCQICDAVLDANWELDHKIPFAAGGETIIGNSQALCRSCNRRKGARLDDCS